MNAVSSKAELKALQRQMAAMLFRPLNADWDMDRRGSAGEDYKAEAAGFIKPNDRLDSFERLEIYTKSYWFRVLDCFYDDYPGLHGVLGDDAFLRLATAYLAKCPSTSYTLRDLGQHLVRFLTEEPRWMGRRRGMALDMARFEWAQIVAFDGPSKKPITPDDLLDANPAELKLGLQPYLSLLELDYGVDEYLVALKEGEEAKLRGEASNAIDSAPDLVQKRGRRRMPVKEHLYLAVHRHQNQLYHKRVERPAFLILNALRDGSTLEDACAGAVEDDPTAVADWPTAIRDWFDNWSYLGWLTKP